MIMKKSLDQLETSSFSSVSSQTRMIAVLCDRSGLALLTSSSTPQVHAQPLKLFDSLVCLLLFPLHIDTRSSS